MGMFKRIAYTELSVLDKE